MTIPLVRVHGVDDVRLDNIDKPRTAPGDVLIEVSLCGICGSDLGYIGMGGLGMTHPMPLGHELVGSVAEVGERVSHLQIGDRVVVNPMAGGNSIGNGGTEGAFTPYLLVRNVAADEKAVIKIPDGLSVDQAAMVEPLSVALHGCRQGNAKAGDKVVIFGAGPIGLCVALCLNYLGVERLVIVDQSSHRLAAAESIGAVPFKAGSNDLGEFLIQQHGQSELMGMPFPSSDIYIEATGAKPVFEQIMNTAKTGARVVVLGLHKQSVPLDLANVLLRELNIVGSMAYSDEFPAVIEMLTSGKIDMQPIISHRFPLSQFSEAIAQASEPDEAIKVLIDCQC
jgi:2-desacetyl-2-hydroxyethyl bacteriochlorophyllide A dehydrogenase